MTANRYFIVCPLRLDHAAERRRVISKDYAAVWSSGAAATASRAGAAISTSSIDGKRRGPGTCLRTRRYRGHRMLSHAVEYIEAHGPSQPFRPVGTHLKHAACATVSGGKPKSGLEPNMAVFGPEGWEPRKAEQPATTYEMFKREILNEIARLPKHGSWPRRSC
jgi:hypothetical protein